MAKRVSFKWILWVLSRESLGNPCFRSGRGFKRHELQTCPALPRRLDVSSLIVCLAEPLFNERLTHLHSIQITCTLINRLFSGGELGPVRTLLFPPSDEVGTRFGFVYCERRSRKPMKTVRLRRRQTKACRKPGKGSLILSRTRIATSIIRQSPREANSAQAGNQ